MSRGVVSPFTRTDTLPSRVGLGHQSAHEVAGLLLVSAVTESSRSRPTLPCGRGQRLARLPFVGTGRDQH